MSNNDGIHERNDWFQFHFSSIRVFGEQQLIAAPMGQGVLRKYKTGEWEDVNRGLPEGTHVNRLYVEDERLLACTNNGLFRFQEDEWEPSALAVGCYQYKQIGRMSLAATQYGLWSGIKEQWSKTAYTHAIVYDLLYLPQFIVLALDRGIAIYDRLADAWMDYTWGKAVTSLAVYDGRILGVTEKGELLAGDKKGGFERIQFDNVFLFSVVTKGNHVFICSDRGLYRLTCICGNLSLVSVQLGTPVTDLDMDGDRLYMTTLFQGVQTIGQ
ncbi:hypothetical protein AB6A23_02445 [Paenibacillus tarimensis]